MSLSELALVVAERLPSMVTLLVSLMGGVGGAALLEVWWRPRRDRRQAAVILTGEIINNLQLCILHAHARERDPKKVPLDFRLDARGWNAAAGKLAELPPDLVKNVMLLYMRFEALNDSVKFYSEYLDRYEAAKAQGVKVAARAERALVSTLDVFNVGIDKAIEEGKERLAELLPFTGLKDSGDGAPVRSYARAVDDFFREREARISSLLE